MRPFSKAPIFSSSRTSQLARHHPLSLSLSPLTLFLRQASPDALTHLPPSDPSPPGSRRTVKDERKIEEGVYISSIPSFLRLSGLVLIREKNRKSVKMTPSPPQGRKELKVQIATTEIKFFIFRFPVNHATSFTTGSSKIRRWRRVQPNVGRKLETMQDDPKSLLNARSRRRFFSRHAGTYVTAERDIFVF